MYLKRNHTKTDEEVRLAVEEIAKKLSDAWGISYHWDEDELKFKRTGISGFIRVNADSVEVDIQKSFFLPISESTIESKVNEYFDRYL